MAFVEIIEDGEQFVKKIEDTEFILRRLSKEAAKRIRKRHTKKTKNFRTGTWEIEADDDAIGEDVIDYCIVGWKNVYSPVTGKPVECTRENKLKLPLNVIEEISSACDVENVSGMAGEQKNAKSGT